MNLSEIFFPELEYFGNNAPELWGPIFRAWISIIPFFFVTEPSHLQTLLSNGRLTKKNMFYTLLHNFIGEGLITNNGNAGCINLCLFMKSEQTLCITCHDWNLICLMIVALSEIVNMAKSYGF